MVLTAWKIVGGLSFGTSECDTEIAWRTFGVSIRILTDRDYLCRDSTITLRIGCQQ